MPDLSPPAARPVNAGVAAPPPLLVAASVALGLGLNALVPVQIGPRTATAVLSGVAFAAAGILGVFAARTMRRARTTIRPSGATTAIVVDGPFRWTRNPLYLSLLTLHVGAALAVNGAAVLVPLVPTFALLRWGVVGREERYLEQTFGAEYLAYRARVRRWL